MEPMLPLHTVWFATTRPVPVVTSVIANKCTCKKCEIMPIMQQQCTWEPLLCEASKEVQGALQQTNPGVEVKSNSYLLCSSKQHPVGTCQEDNYRRLIQNLETIFTSQDSGHFPFKMSAQHLVASGMVA